MSSVKRLSYPIDADSERSLFVVQYKNMCIDWLHLLANTQWMHEEVNYREYAAYNESYTTCQFWWTSLELRRGLKAPSEGIIDDHSWSTSLPSYGVDSGALLDGASCIDLSCELSMIDRFIIGWSNPMCCLDPCPSLLYWFHLLSSNFIR